jgi:hypothetical protein
MLRTAAKGDYQILSAALILNQLRIRPAIPLSFM